MNHDFQHTDKLGNGIVRHWLTEGDKFITQANYSQIGIIDIISWPLSHYPAENTVALWYPKGKRDRNTYLDLDTGHD